MNKVQEFIAKLFKIDSYIAALVDDMRASEATAKKAMADLIGARATINKLRDYHKKVPFTAVVPESNIDSVKLHYNEVDAIIKQTFPNIRCYRVLDEFCYTIDKDVVHSLVEENTMINDEEYIVNDHDCDDYALALNGFFAQKSLSKYAVGMMVSRNHAYNFLIDNNRGLWLIEPQGGLPFKYDGRDSYNSIEYIV